MTAKPIVGIICCSRSVDGQPAQTVVERYVRATARFADVSVLLVPTADGTGISADIAARLDGLLLTGSPSNVHPSRYGVDDDDAGPFDPNRDKTAFALVQAMREAGKPVFGICRGFQELNVIFGGSLRRDVSTDAAPLPHHAPLDESYDAMFDHGHPVKLVEGGVLAGILPPAPHVNSVHFQGIERLGNGLRIEATAPDGLIEAFSAQDGPPLVAVQWHPEWQPEKHPESIAFFQMFGRAVRGQNLATPAL